MLSSLLQENLMQVNAAVTTTRIVSPKVTRLDHRFTPKRALESVTPHQAASVPSYLVFPQLPLPPSDLFLTVKSVIFIKYTSEYTNPLLKPDSGFHYSYRLVLPRPFMGWLTLCPGHTLCSSHIVLSQFLKHDQFPPTISVFLHQ